MITGKQETLALLPDCEEHRIAIIVHVAELGPSRAPNDSGQCFPDGRKQALSRAGALRSLQRHE